VDARLRDESHAPKCGELRNRSNVSAARFKIKDVLDGIPSEMPVDYYDFSVVNSLDSGSGGKERSEAIEFLLPKSLAKKFATSDITNQELLDKGQVLVNGVRIALNLQMAE
jgi:hypothetical protein